MRYPNPRRVGVVGSGEVGQALAAGLARHGYEARIGTRTPGKLSAFSRGTGIPAASFSEVAAWAEAIVLAVAGTAALSALGQAGQGALAGKLVVDVTNPITDDPPQDGVIRYFTGPNESLMEQLQATYPDACFVKAFNSVGSALMVNPELRGGKPTMFYCGDDPEAKRVVAGIIEQFGWSGEDMGRGIAARALEPLAILWCIPGFLHDDWMHAFQVLRP